ncbi:hypothetical protein R1sor_024420 [Riccia sorocarpa]|uniref:Reverse transcriptase domain-containing protein n=1 Tax=Riccia sorocarpa TaxID=122646 RepID=A0ABD3GSW4_9MARC
MTGGREVQKTFDSILPGASVIEDRKEDGTIDTVLLLDRKLNIIDRGCSGRGYAVWATFNTAVGIVGVIGVHSPRLRLEKEWLWGWVQQLVMEGQWLLIGDMNMVEYSRDTIGPSPILKGRELRKWTLCANAGDLSDIWLEAVQTRGPWFTRQAMHGNRLDQARLDRCYITKRGDWIFQMEEMLHDGSSSLADHVPIRISLILEGETRTVSKKSYFKMDGSLLKNEGIRREVERTWSAHPDWANDDRKRWGLALARTRKILLAHKRTQTRGEMDAEEISKRLALARLQVQVNDSTSNRREFEEALMAARRREQADMRICRVKCRIKWLADGDAPSKYFFACLKAKTKREELTSIKLDSGEVLVDEDRILQLIEDTYGNLYTAEEEGSEALEKRREILQLVDKRLTAAQNRKLEDTPTEELIEEIVKTLPHEKSPGFDGVTSEVLVEGWDFMRGDCFKMVRKDTLSALGMSADNVRRIQGLVTGGAAQVHVNGRFTRRFEVTRGVRQGCPVAPLLFAMVTQPLMRLLREEEARGRLMGVNYGGQTTLLHQIYADDTGVNLTMEESQFNRLKATIQVFEEISGARLNLAKSLIMPISPEIILDWVRTTGCDIAGPGKSFLYLGVTTCNPIDEAVIAKAITQKMLKRLAHWSNRFLSWPAKIILLKQVLAATPLYQLLSVGLEQKGLEALESLCRQFLWGWVDQDHPRASMVAWERITQHK